MKNNLLFITCFLLFTHSMMAQEEGQRVAIQLTADHQLMVCPTPVFGGVIIGQATADVASHVLMSDGSFMSTLNDFLTRRLHPGNSPLVPTSGERQNPQEGRDRLELFIGNQGSDSLDALTAQMAYDELARHNALGRICMESDRHAAKATIARLQARDAAARRHFLPFDEQRCMGQDSLDVRHTFATHRIPDGYPYLEPIERPFNVLVGGSCVALYNDRNYWGGTVDFGSFEMQQGTDVTIDIICKDSLTNYELLPQSPSYRVRQTAPNALRITTHEANCQLTLIAGGDARTGHVLHLFCNAFQPEAAPADVDYYFPAGYHSLQQRFGGPLTVSGSQQVYIAPGAVVDGTIRIGHADGAVISGSGMVVNAGGTLLNVDGSRHCSISGITLHGHRPQGWQTIVHGSELIDIRHLKIISTRYASTDGLNFVSSSHCRVDSCFIRACDDAIAIKGMGSTPPSQSPEVTDLRFSHLQLWNDCNNAFTIGAETRARQFSHISLTDTDILFSYDDPEYHTQLDERAALGICCLHGTYFNNLLYDDIRVYHCERLIAMGFKPSFWFGTILGDQSTAGGIKHVTFRNIRSLNHADSPIANEVLLNGWQREGTPTKLIEHITFDHVLVEGRPIDRLSHPLLKINDPTIVRPIKIKK
ncbi:MAG: hypothetical protein IJR71_01380 [Prevotella sp.]|nr:hypothetical protein [Prevotella sp.]